MIIYLQDHPLGVSHKLGDPADRYLGDLIAELRTVIVAKHVPGQAGDRFIRDLIHPAQDPGPHLVIAALRNGVAIRHREEIGPVFGFKVLDIFFHVRKDQIRNGDGPIPVF